MIDARPPPAVSVVIAAYNMAQYVESAVSSVLAQTYADLEIVVIDDGSTDNIAVVMRAFADDPRVRFLPQSNQGQPKAKNAGIKAARGRFIAFCDADDLWEPRKLELQLPRFEDPAVGVVYSATATIDRAGSKTGEISGSGPSGYVLPQLFVKNFVPFGTTVVRRSVIDDCGMFDESFAMGIDWDLWLRVARDWQFAFVDEPLYLYRVWPGQMSKNWKGRYEHSFRIMRKFIEKYPQALPRRVIRRAYADSYVQQGICYAILEKDRRRALGEFWRGARTDPFFWMAWKEMGKLFVRRLQSR
jgi:glycosyltransferase involved in cell wall biosynthesis